MEEELQFDDRYVCKPVPLNRLLKNHYLQYFSKADVIYSSQKLHEAHYIKINLASVNGSPLKGDYLSITYDGHEFLDKIRKNEIWEGAKAVGLKIGCVSINTISLIASNIISELIKVHYGIDRV
ncbi:MAG: DUF2513 domain-containing protein [Clostridia bacterium]|nr:DUF2513 domain-containing protein [Clostridia bacterium]